MSQLVLRDSIKASGIPADTPVVAGYGDGLYEWSADDWARFPSSVCLSIVVRAGDQGDILDVERFDASPADVPGWIDRFDRPGRRLPTIYCDRSTIDAVRQAAAGRPFDWWAATLDGTTEVPGAVAVQHVDVGPYDESVILDPRWVGGAMTPEEHAWLSDVTRWVDQVAAPNLAAIMAARAAEEQWRQQVTAQLQTLGAPNLAQLEQQVADLQSTLGRIEVALRGLASA